MTYVPEWSRGLEYWKALAESKAGNLHVVYGGDETFTRKGIKVVSWQDVGR
jgi:hypothetical protein